MTSSQGGSAGKNFSELDEAEAEREYEERRRAVMRQQVMKSRWWHQLNYNMKSTTNKEANIKSGGIQGGVINKFVTGKTYSKYEQRLQLGL